MSEFEFTLEQKKAIEHSRGHLRILACAGSGKTEIVSQRIARLIEKGVNPKNIVAFTFTEKAADELKSRIRGILDERCPERADFGEMYVGTIHSFCFYMLQQLDPRFKTYEVLDEAKRVAYISKYNNFCRLNLWPLRYSHRTGNQLSYYSTIDRFIYSIDVMMMEDIEPAKLKNKYFKHAYLEYRKMLDEDRYLDFSSMIQELLHLLRRDRNKLKKFNERVKYLVVDEYQDVNKVQEALIELIAIGAESICVVGDDDQCIYQWRGSHIDNIIDFKTKYSKKCRVVDIPLNVNFRSTRAIIHTAENFIKQNRRRLAIKKMTFNPELRRQYEKGDIMHKHFNTEEEEFSFIVNKIKELERTEFIDKKNRPFSLSPGDFAVLVRTNDDAARIIPFFERRGVDCIAFSGNSIFDREEVILAIDCIRHIFSLRGYRSKYPVVAELKQRYDHVFPRDRFPLAKSPAFAAKLTVLKKDMDRILKKSPKDYLGDLGLQAVYHRILSAMGAEKFDFGEVYNYNLAVLSQAISDYESVWVRLRASEVKDFFRFTFAYGEGHYVEIQHSDPTLVNAVKILTIHKSKGLEFPVVFVPGLVEKRPQNQTPCFVDETLYDVKRYNGTLEDERRLFYTAITRSEKYLFLTGSKKRPTAQKHYEPHKFIKELDKKYISGIVSHVKDKSRHPPRLNRTAIYPTSFSELTTYDRCPYDFRLRHIFGYNAGVPAAFGYGTNIHNILNVIHNNYIEKKKIPTDRDIEQFFDKLFKLRYATEKIQKNMEKTAKKIVKNYVNLHKDEFRYILETEKRFEFVIDEAIISGQIDLLKKVDEKGNVREVEIIDFKTESDKDDNLYKLDHEKQLRFYALACLRSLGLSPQKACIHHLERRRNMRDYVDISAEQLNMTREKIAKGVRNILNRKFPAKPLRICRYCDYCYICCKKNT